MATNLKNLSDYDPGRIPDASNLKFGIVVSEWNEEITSALLEGAVNTLKKHQAAPENIFIKTVPGSFELTFGARIVARNYSPDAVICLGCVIKGETPHFNYICQSVSQGITELNLDYEIPFIFGVLTTNNLKEARDRAGGKYGNKGDEAAVTAIKMALLRHV
ncbi:MAG: 6,7-dimethyl-8-ribityllumazine synthase [Bacteroidales bacterium]|nr:6,7-dimethyl-8-ribityllumazine synthase [Bacteroidales bacterium]MBN2697883.1 6,7-dimethyl-8-ribityllumazine synthase [Bacteroidales bacterium]